MENEERQNIDNVTKRINKYSEEDLVQIVQDASKICDKFMKDEPLSPKIASVDAIGFGGLSFDGSWVDVRRLLDTISFALGRRKKWENPDNEDLAKALDNMRMALHNSMAWALTQSKYSKAYKFLNEKDSFYQDYMKHQNELAMDPFKKAQKMLMIEKQEERYIPAYTSSTHSFYYKREALGTDNYWYMIDYNGDVRKSKMYWNPVLQRSEKEK